MVVYAPKIRYHYPLRYVIPVINAEEMTFCLPNKWKYGLPIENNHVSFTNEIKNENYNAYFRYWDKFKYFYNYRYLK